MKSIGLIGAGTMGISAGRKILEGGYLLVAHDSSPHAQENARGIGAKVTKSPVEVAKETEIVLMFLPGPKEVESCMTGSEGLLSGSRHGLSIVDMSTVDPGTTQRMAGLARQMGVGYLDAPVLGRPASVGNWVLPVGGSKEDLDRCKPVLQLFAAKIFHIGDSGAGNKVKLLNQLMFGAINAMTAEMMAIAERLEIEPKILYETISASQAATVSGLFKELGRRIAGEDYDNPTFTVDLIVKDVRLAVQMAKEGKAPPILGRAVELINEMAQAQGLGRADTAIMWKSVKKIWEK